MKKRKWSNYLWVVELLYLCLGLFNILFAWLGMLFFTIPLLVAVFGGSKPTAIDTADAASCWAYWTKS